MNPQERLVMGSEFQRVADTYALLLMAYPPAFTGLADDFDTDGLLTAINEARVGPDPLWHCAPLLVPSGRPRPWWRWRWRGALGPALVVPCWQGSGARM